MASSRQFARVMFAATVAAALAVPALADDLPQPTTSGGVTYVTGGFGDAEQQALAADSHDYNLAITSANAGGAYAADIQFAIEQGGRQVLQVADGGPLFYAKLPPGQYEVVATSGGVSRKQRIDVPNDGQARLNLTFPQQ